LEACLQRSAATGALLVHPYDHPHTVAGAATVGMELMGQAPDLDTVLVAAGGGGLAAGVAVWYQGDRRVVIVEPERCASWASARMASNDKNSISSLPYSLFQERRRTRQQPGDQVDRGRTRQFTVLVQALVNPDSKSSEKISSKYQTRATKASRSPPL
jgi:hypothetical protein